MKSTKEKKEEESKEKKEEGEDEGMDEGKWSWAPLRNGGIILAMLGLGSQ